METGIFQILGLMRLFVYMRIDDELMEISPIDGSSDQQKGLKAGARLFLGVYRIRCKYLK